ncbi:unnamed protein product [Nippostrongylus brasiliensis]|uniref:Transmembrane protein n=1 Tax=Nippostrongylus brasiliensis TaxID=27835 RepID=A0A0N4Y768_NIPBR|nr:unnamed protein product [Nippostrongylus brasiliensis]
MYKIHREGGKEKEKEKEKESLKNDKKRGPGHADDDEKSKLGYLTRTSIQSDLQGEPLEVNPRQAVTSFVSAATGLAAITVGTVYIYRLPESAVKAKKLVIILIIYGVLQVLLATAFFVTCMQTSIAVSKGVKDAFQIVVGLMVALVYVAISLVSMVVGIFGFYKAVALVSFVDYTDTSSMLYCPQVLFYTSLVVFVLHIILIVTKCCCCK